MTGNYLPHQQRVVDEKTELDVKLCKLNVFLGGLAFAALPDFDKRALQMQQKFMEGYSDVLDMRIKAFQLEILNG